MSHAFFQENVIAWLTENESNTAVHTAHLVQPENNSLEFIVRFYI